MITDRTLANLRTSAALALLVPGISVAVRVGDRTVVEASRGEADASHPVLPVCAFHRSVVRAHDYRRSGTRVEMVGVDGNLEPEVLLQCGPELRQVPGGVIRRTADTWLHLCALSLGVDAVEPATAAVVDEFGIDGPEVHLHADRSLDVTIAVTDTPAGDKPAARRAVEMLETIAARATVDALEHWVVPSGHDWEQLLVRPEDEPSAGSVPGVPRRP